MWVLLCFVGASRWQRALQGVIVAIFGLAKLVKEEDDSLKAKNQYDSSNETGSIEGGLLWWR